MSSPLNEEAPDSAVSADQKITVYETPARDYPQHGSVSISLNHSKRQSTTIQIAKSTAESLRDQLNAMLAVPADTVNSVEELEAMPVGSVIRGGKWEHVAEKIANSPFIPYWWTTGCDYEADPRYLLPAIVLYRPEANDGR